MLRISSKIKYENKGFVIESFLAVKGTVSNIKTLCILRSESEFYESKGKMKPLMVKKWIDGSMYPQGTQFVYESYLPLRRVGEKWMYWNDLNYRWDFFKEGKNQKLNERYDPVFGQVASFKVKSIETLLQEGLII